MIKRATVLESGISKSYRTGVSNMGAPGPDPALKSFQGGPPKNFEQTEIQKYLQKS